MVFLLRVEILPWDSDAADAYAQLRTACENEGRAVGRNKPAHCAACTLHEIVLPIWISVISSL